MGWGEIVDPDGDVAVKEHDGGLSITIPAKHHDLTHTKNYSMLNAPRVLQPVDGDFTVSVVIKAFPLPKGVPPAGGTHSYQSCGLLIWQDDRNFIRIERAANAKAPRPFVWIEQFAAGKAVSSKLVSVFNQDVPLRVSRTGDRFTYYVNTDKAMGWSKVFEENIKWPERLQVGVTAINSAARVFPARMKDLKIEAQAK